MPGAQSAHAEAEAIKVGAVLAVTGPASFLGGPEARTLEMLTEEINAKGGVNGYKMGECLSYPDRKSTF